MIVINFLITHTHTHTQCGSAGNNTEVANVAFASEHKQKILIFSSVLYLTQNPVIKYFSFLDIHHVLTTELHRVKAQFPFPSRRADVCIFRTSVSYDPILLNWKAAVCREIMKKKFASSGKRKKKKKKL